MNPNKNTDPDGLAWLRTIRSGLLHDLDKSPAQRAAYYQAKEKHLHARLHRGRSAVATAKSGDS